MLFSESGIALIFGIHFHHDVVLIEAGVHGRDLALAEGVVERVVDVVHGEAQARGGIAVDDEVRFQAMVLLVGGSIAQLGHRLHLVEQLRRPFVQIVQVVILQRVLVLRVAGASADVDVLNRLQEQLDAGDTRQLGAQAIDDLVGGGFALAAGLERDEHAAHVGGGTTAAAAGECQHVIHTRILLHDRCELPLLHLHGVEGNVLDARAAPPMRPVSCCGKKPLGTMM